MNVNEFYIRQIINDWDPIDLFPYSPKDEYETEIHLITKLLQGTNDINELAKGIQKTFILSFGEDVFTKSYEECVLIAKKLINKKTP